MMTGEEDYKAGLLADLPAAVATVIRRAYGRSEPYRSFHQILEELDRLRDWD
jgi:hypothetical protein